GRTSAHRYRGWGVSVVPNVLAERYASADMRAIWSPEHKVVLERRLWLAVLRAQVDLGVDVPAGAVEAYEAVVDKVDLGSIAARSHNVPAQATTLGKRFATTGEELLVALDRLEDLLARYPLRGIKGPVGTQQDMLDVLGGDAAKVDELERRVAEHLGFARVLG